MTSFTDGIRAHAPLQFRAWQGVVADLWRAEGLAGGGGHYVSPDPRIVIFLDEGAQAVRLSDQPEFGAERRPTRISFVPAGTPLWSRISESRSFVHLDLHLEQGHLNNRLQGIAAQEVFEKLVFIADSPRIMALADMLVAEIQDPRRPDLLLDGLTDAILTEVFDLSLQPAEPARGGLTPRQQRRIVDHMQAAICRRVPIGELAEVAGLSESWFSHAFKQSFGMTPYRWQLELRLDHARALLVAPDVSLTDVASAAGFADQAHFTRAFRSAMGTTPAAFRRQSVPLQRN